MSQRINIVRIDTGASNVYLILQGTSSIIVDAGRKGSRDKILKKAKENGLKPTGIKAIFLTHTHYDHTGSLQELKEATGADVIVHEAEARFVREGFTPLPKGTILPTKIIVSLAHGPLENVGKFDPVEPDITFKDELDLSNYGIDGRLIHVPGHSIGSSLLLLNDGSCIVGDTMFNVFPRSVYPPFADDEDLLMRTWERIMEMRIKRFHPGHGKPFLRERFLRTFEKRGNKR
jgi:glyoxylase-like metal-dependent hydrolase (beta-lactamase superfamily II)